MSVSLYDDGLFYCKKGDEFIGLLTCHVDDIQWGGTQLFKKSVIDIIGQIFSISKSNSKAFKYVGINMIQKTDGSVEMEQQDYAASLSDIELNRQR